MKTPFRRVMACALLLGSFEALAAQHSQDASRFDDGESLVVAAPVTVAAWSARFNSTLDEHLSYPRTVGIGGTPEGIVKVKFNCSDSGAPSDVALMQSSGSRALDRELIRAIRNVQTLHPLPSGASGHTQFQAWIVFAHDEQSAARMMRSLRRDVNMAQVAPKDSGDTHLAQLTVVGAAR